MEILPRPPHQWSLPEADCITIHPIKATKSTTTGHYRLWQGIRDPNQDLNTLPNSQISPCNMKPSSKCLCFIFLLLLCLTLDYWCGIAQKRKQSCHRRFSGGPDRTDGSPLMQWGYRNGRHASLIYAISVCPSSRGYTLSSIIAYSVFFYSLSLLLFALIPILLSQKFTRGVYIRVCAWGRNVSHEKLKVNEECWYVSSY